MCNACRRNSLKPEYEVILHKAYNNELNTEEEWSNIYTKVKSYTSPFFNWLAGSSTPSVKPAPMYAPVPEKTPTTLPGSGNGSANERLQKIINVMSRKGYVIYTKPYQLNIVGIRATSAQPNSFDDTMNVFYKDNAGNWQYRQWAITTDPGEFYLNNPMNVNGTAIVVPGQYINSHKIGLHRGEYTALVQKGPVKVYRDNNKDDVLDFNSGNIVSGVFGINIHKAGSSSTKVDKWSAGCQVFARSADFATFIQLCQQHKSLHGDNFSYSLIEEKDLLYN